jgi:hypothetical protein
MEHLINIPHFTLVSDQSIEQILAAGFMVLSFSLGFIGGNK